MTNKKLNLIVGAGIFLFLAAFACALAGWLVFHPPNAWGLPTYAMDQTNSTHEGYRRTTLTHDDTVYVNDYEESALIAFGEQPAEMIGRFPASVGDSGLYAIPGQDPSAYVLEYDPMYQAVYRNINHPPFDWRGAEFQMMRLMIPAANPKESSDAQIIAEVVSALQGGNPKTVPMQSDGAYAGVQNYQLILFSDQLPGLAYVAGVHVDENGNVFLAENVSANQWFPAGTLFSEWMKSP